MGTDLGDMDFYRINVLRFITDGLLPYYLDISR